MRFFKQAKKIESWLSFSLRGDGIAAARISRVPGARPAVETCVFYAGRPDADLLEKAGRELRAATFHCTTVLSGGEYQMLAGEAPNVPADELKTAVRWRLKDMLDFHVDDATIDVLDIPADKNATVRTNHGMFAVAARNSVIEKRQALFATAKVGLSVIDIPEMAQRNISTLVEPEGCGLAMLSFGADGGLLTVTFTGELYLSRRIDVTLEQLLDTDHDRKHASFDKITLELQRSLDHFDRQFHFISVSKLLLAPSAVTGLEEYLSSNLYTPVQTMDLGDALDISGVPELLDKAAQQRFFFTIGAALRHEETRL
ncbi:agglutinin biogenesis protein MshI [Massilia sp. RP-1-19]|uniref:Agglutinin biogenesis protein MshI n=1 Tax=Massilia polaris TaxID=2728846 RepID=A0A848HI01_9BURK|nr:agglutinin biogenesis protein MshI [Massilia polaris]NML60844.1 agglutinin biogenesis protein MshI [Massilia polaris]